MPTGIQYVANRYDELADLLNNWGYVVVPVPDVSQWNEIVAASPLTGLVKLRGEREQDGDVLSFTITEFWIEGDLGSDAAIMRAGASLARYHYHGQSRQGGVRWCLYSEGHPDMPFHWHAWPEAGAAARAQYIEAPAALAEFESFVYLEMFGSQAD